MIKSEQEYQKAVARLKDEQEAINQTREQLKCEGLTEDQIKRVLDPMISFRSQLEEEVHTYERIKRGDIQEIDNFYGLGRSLIAMRISTGKSQKEVAESLGMNPANFHRLEKNEFHGAKHELMIRVMEALGFRAKTTFERVA